MTVRRRIQYDYKVRLEWGKGEPRSRRLGRWLIALAGPATLIVLGGMASSRFFTQREFHLAPFTASSFTSPAPTAEKVLRLPVRSAAPMFPDTGDLDAEDSGESHFDHHPNAIATAEPTTIYTSASFAYEPEAEMVAFDADHDTTDWKTVTVKRGDNLSLIFGRLGLSGADLDRILGLGGDVAGLKQLSPDQNIRFRIKDGELAEMIHEIDYAHTLHVRNDGGDFTSETVVEPLETRQVHVSGVIDSSLFEAGQTAGLSDALIMKLADIFGYDIDFVLDLREGDRFTVIYEEIFKNGEKIKDGNILAAEFANQDRVYRGVRYLKADGVAEYYTPDGAAMRKAFLRTPVEFTRITSLFSGARRHPVLNKIRAHKGVDYAAPIGTPVKATADAKVAYVGWQGGYGKNVVLEHTGGYSTAYGHLSGYAKGIRAGVPVRQGQTIGYVGKTGLATGPHLHYEFRVAGVHRDPLKVPLPEALPIPSAQLASFRAATGAMLAELDEAVRLAASGSGPTTRDSAKLAAAGQQ